MCPAASAGVIGSDDLVNCVDNQVLATGSCWNFVRMRTEEVTQD
jgi:hypothetical protein